MSNLCNAAACAKNALDKVVCEAVSSATLNIYAQIVDFFRNTLSIDFTLLFQLIALLSVICWIQTWLVEIINLICKIPKFIKHLLCGKINFCLLNCNETKSESSGFHSTSEDY